MFWFGIPAVIALGVVAVEYLSDDETDNSKNNTKNGKNQKKNKTSSSKSHTTTEQRRSSMKGKRQFLNDLAKFKSSERERLSSKYNVNIYYPKTYLASFRESDLYIDQSDQMQKIEEDLQYIDTLLIEIEKMEKKYVNK